MIGNKEEKYILIETQSIKYDGQEKWVKVVAAADTLPALLSNYSSRQLAQQNLQAFKAVVPKVEEV